MPYETGTASNLQDLLEKLATFAGANGWTVHFSGARTGGAGSSGRALILSRGVVQATLRTNNGAGSTNDPGPWVEAGLWAGTYNAASTESQPNASTFTNCNWMTGPYVAYHAFTPGAGAARPYLHVVVEVTSGIFRHFGIGQLRQLGAYTNGAYAYGTNQSFNTSSSHINTADSGANSYPFEGGTSTGNISGNVVVRADFGGVSPRYCVTFNNSSAIGRLWCGWRDTSTTLYGSFFALSNCGPSAFTGRAPLLPLLCFVQADSTDTLRHPIGFPDDVRYIDVTNFNPGDTVTLGADTWRIFPVVRKGAARVGPPGVQNSWRYGLAYRQNA